MFEVPHQIYSVGADKQFYTAKLSPLQDRSEELEQKKLITYITYNQLPTLKHFIRDKAMPILVILSV